MGPMPDLQPRFLSCKRSRAQSLPKSAVRRCSRTASGPPFATGRAPSVQDSNMTLRFTALSMLAASLIWLAHPHLAGAQPPPVRDEVTQVLIPMELLANRPLVRAMVNGQG